jgi:hypothetical protein
MSMLRFKYHSTPPNYKFVQQQPSGYPIKCKNTKITMESERKSFTTFGSFQVLKKICFQLPAQRNLSQRLKPLWSVGTSRASNP